MLETYGTFRELTLGHGGPGNPGGSMGKRVGVNDLASVINSPNSNSPNDGCNPHAQPWSHAGNCLSL